VNEPNDALAALVVEAGFSWAGLARRVNDLGAIEGLALRYDYTAVNRWVKRGETPRSPVPTLLARALTERVGRRISPSDFGMTEEETLAARGLEYGDDPHATVDTIIDLGRADVKRRDIVKAPFVLAALGAPSRDWLLATLDETTTERGPRQVGMRQVAGIREMFALFQDMDVMRKEIFGPVLPLMRVRTEEEAVRLANDSHLGLLAYVFTRDRKKGERLAERIEAGTVMVNGVLDTYAAPETPWGGVKQSGIGVSHSDDGLRAMCQARHVNVDRIAPRRDLWWYPYSDASHKLMLRGMRLLFGRRFR